MTKRSETEERRNERLRQQWAECQANFRPVLAEMEAEGFRAIADYQGHKPYRLRAFDGDQLVGLVYLGSKCEPMTDWHRRLDVAEVERQRERQVDADLAELDPEDRDRIQAARDDARGIDPKVGERYLVPLYPSSPKSEVVIETAGPKVVRYREIDPPILSQAGHDHYRRQGFPGWEKIEPLTAAEFEHAEEAAHGPAEDELLAHQGYTRKDELAMIAHHEEMDREMELEQQHGGRRRCGECGQFEVESRTVSTGVDQSEFTKCRNCGHETFAG